jgi:hypothetical protein
MDYEHDLSTADGILAELRDLADELSVFSSARAELLHLAERIAAVLTLQADAQAAADQPQCFVCSEVIAVYVPYIIVDAQTCHHIFCVPDSDPTPAHGIEVPAMNSCVFCLQPGAAWDATAGQFQHMRCLWVKRPDEHPASQIPQWSQDEWQAIMQRMAARRIEQAAWDRDAVAKHDQLQQAAIARQVL